MKNVKNIIAIVTLISVLGVGNSFAGDLTAKSISSDQQYSQSAQSWFDNLFNYVKGYLTGDSNTANRANAGIATNHNETLVRDEN